MDAGSSLVRDVARRLRYRTLDGMIGQEVTLTGRTRIRVDTEAFVARFVDGCVYVGPEQRNLEGQIGKYGLLDLQFGAPSVLLGDAPRLGVALLRELGFLDEDAQVAAALFLDDPSACLKELRDDLDKHRCWLKLLLKDREDPVAGMSARERGLRYRNRALLDYPMVFRVVDACVASSASVWMNKHVYL
jgi:hypothetical protein